MRNLKVWPQNLQFLFSTFCINFYHPQLVHGKKFSVEKTSDSFRVKLPLLTQKTTNMTTSENIENSKYLRTVVSVEEIKGFYSSIIAYCIVIPFLIKKYISICKPFIKSNRISVYLLYQSISLTTVPIWFSFKVKLLIGLGMVLGCFILIKKSDYVLRLSFCPSISL